MSNICAHQQVGYSIICAYLHEHLSLDIPRRTPLVKSSHQNPSLTLRLLATIDKPAATSQAEQSNSQDDVVGFQSGAPRSVSPYIKRSLDI